MPKCRNVTTVKTNRCGKSPPAEPPACEAEGTRPTPLVSRVGRIVRCPEVGSMRFLQNQTLLEGREILSKEFVFEASSRFAPWTIRHQSVSAIQAREPETRVSQRIRKLSKILVRRKIFEFHGEKPIRIFGNEKRLRNSLKMGMRFRNSLGREQNFGRKVGWGLRPGKNHDSPVAVPEELRRPRQVPIRNGRRPPPNNGSCFVYLF